MQRLTYPLQAVFVFLIAVLVLLSCADNNSDEWGPDCVDTIKFATHVQPIVSTKCAIHTCHDGNNNEVPNWNEFENLRDAALDGKVKAYVVGHIMPPANTPGEPLTQEEINTIACWADLGAKNN